MNSMHIIKYLKNDDNNITVLNNLAILYIPILFLSTHLGDSLFFIMIILFMFNENLKVHIQTSLQHPIVKATLVYIFIYTIWSFTSDNIDVALYKLDKNMIFVFPVFYVAILRYKYINKILFSFFLTMLIGSIWSLLMVADIVNSPVQVCEGPFPFLYKGDFEFFLVIFVGYAFFKLFDKSIKNYLLSSLYILYIIIVTIDISLLPSRTFLFLYTVIIIAIFILLYKGNYFKIIVSSIIIFFLSTLIYTYNNHVQTTVDFALNNIKQGLTQQNYNTSSGARIGMITYSIPIIKNNFFLGIGTGDSVQEVLKLINKDVNNENREQYTELLRALNGGKSSFLHNTYIQNLVELGLIGLIIFLNIFYQVLKYKQKIKLYKNMLIIIVILYLSMSFAGADLMFFQLGKAIMLLISLLTIPFKKECINNERL